MPRTGQEVDVLGTDDAAQLPEGVVGDQAAEAWLAGDEIDGGAVGEGQPAAGVDARSADPRRAQDGVDGQGRRLRQCLIYFQ